MKKNYTVMTVSADKKFTGELMAIDWESLGVKRLISCTSGEQALEIAAKESVDVAVSDVRLSDMQGVAFVQRLRNFIPDIKVIFYTSERDFDRLREAMALDVYAYVIKPAEEAILCRYVSEALAGRSKFDAFGHDAEIREWLFGGERAAADVDDGIAVAANEIIQKRYAEKISVGEVARKLYISESHLMHEMKRTLGISFHDCLTKCRIAHAKQLLKQGDMKIKEVAYAVGIADARYFARVFKKATGMTPKEYLNLP